MSAVTLSRCRSCGAPIYWAETAAGKPLPVDAAHDDAGTAVLRLVTVEGVARLTVRIVPVGQPIQPGEKRRTTHWGTCPQAASHRRGGGR